MKTSEGAARHCFLGSPTILVDSQDIDPDPTRNQEYGIKCRMYSVNGKLSSVPSKGILRSAIRSIFLEAEIIGKAQEKKSIESVGVIL